MPRWEESASLGLGEVHPFVPFEAEALVPEELEIEGPQMQEEGLGILQYLDQLEQVTARFFSRLVLLPIIHIRYM